MKIAKHVEQIKTESVRNTKRKEEWWRDDGKDEFRSGAFVMTFFAAIFVNMEFCETWRFEGSCRQVMKCFNYCNLHLTG